MKKTLLLLGFGLLTGNSYAQIYAPEIQVKTIPENNVGIKTDAPQADLHIVDSRAEVRIQNTNPADWSYLRIQGSGQRFWDIAQYGNNAILEFRPNGSSNNRFIIKQDGKIGIRTANPESDLHITGNRAEVRIQNTNSADWSYLRIQGSGQRFWDIAQYGNNAILEFRPNGSSNNRFIIKQDGKIGIRTANPESDLHITGNRAELRIQNTNPADWSYLRIQGSGQNFWDIAQYGNNDILEFRPNGSSSNRIRFAQNGSVSATTYYAVTPPWADFVFESSYALRDLMEVEAFI